jgi:hypothetical protein
MASFRSIVEKADLAVSNLSTDGGYLNPIQANTFIRMVQEQPTILNDVRMVPMNGPRMEINTIGFTSRILKAAPASGTALGASDRSAPTTDKIELLTTEIMAEVHLPYDVLEDNIERGNLEDTIMALVAERTSLDLEELIISGDTEAGADAYLRLKDGIVKQSTSHVVDYTDNPVETIDKSVFKAGIKAMPNKYMRNRPAMRFYVSPDVETEYADSLAGRLTALGDTRVETDYRAGLSPYGVPIKAAALMPDDKYIFTYPQNLIVGMQRQIMIETDRDIRTRMIIIVLTLRLDIKFETEDAVVKCIGLNPNSLTTTSA